MKENKTMRGNLDYAHRATYFIMAAVQDALRRKGWPNSYLTDLAVDVKWLYGGYVDEPPHERFVFMVRECGTYISTKAFSLSSAVNILGSGLIYCYQDAPGSDATRHASDPPQPVSLAEAWAFLQGEDDEDASL